MIKLVKYSCCIVVLFLLSCNGSEKKSKEPTKVEKAYTYSIDTSGIVLHWTAYKFIEKIGVSGRFDTIKFSAKKSLSSIEDVLKSSRIEISTGSVNSANGIRDPKLRATFFRAFNTDTLHGELLEAEEGKGLLALKMNTINNLIEYTYRYTKDTIFIYTHFDLIKWNGKNALEALNKECYDLHKGSDGVSKLWPDVAVKIKLPVKRDVLVIE
jgi:hypothetical protein